MTRWAPRRRAASTASGPTGPLLTTAAVLLGPTSAAIAPNQPVQHVGGGEQARDQLVVWQLGSGDESAVGQWDARVFRLAGRVGTSCPTSPHYACSGSAPGTAEPLLPD